MKFSISKWLAYTFLVGLIPLLTRLLVWAATTDEMVHAVAAPDFLVFGLVLHISIINEIEHLPRKEQDWKTIQNGTAVVFISIYSALYAVNILGEKNGHLINEHAMLLVCLGIALTSITISLIIVHRLILRSAR